MSDALTSAQAPASRLRCTHCGQVMQALLLEGHYGNPQQVDLCAHCHLVWFDAFESVRLSGLGWVALLRAMHAAMAHSPGVLAPQLRCTRCDNLLKPVHNLSRFGRSAALECPRRHGHYQTFCLLLAERGLVRPLGASDRRALDQEGRPLSCLNCGASINASGGHACAHCASPLVVFDLPRLMSSLLIRDALPLPTEQARHVSWTCRGCGAAVDPTRMSRCPQCHHAVVAPALGDVKTMLDGLEPLLRGHRAPRPPPHGARLRRRDHRDTALYRLVTGYVGHWRRLVEPWQALPDCNSQGRVRTRHRRMLGGHGAPCRPTVTRPWKAMPGRLPGLIRLARVECTGGHPA
jgi:DNA-directed RNA polymerase subunit RPC12/RpoP